MLPVVILEPVIFILELSLVGQTLNANHNSDLDTKSSDLQSLVGRAPLETVHLSCGTRFKKLP